MAVGSRRIDALAGAGLGVLGLALLAVVASRLGRALDYNEQWRAYHLSLPGTWLHPSRTTNAPISAGVAAITRLVVALLGNDELALRLPMALSLPALAVLAYRLGRHWLGVTAAALTAGALLLNRMVLTFAGTLAPYTVEAACAVAIVLLWLGTRHRAWRYAGIGALAVVATPAVFVLAPLLVADLARAVRARTWRVLVAPAGAGLAALLHLACYVRYESAQAGSAYWRAYYVPRDPAGAVAAVWRGLASYVPGALTTGTSYLPTVRDGDLGLPPGLRTALAVALLAALLLGVVFAARERDTRLLPYVLGAALAAEVVAALARAWPFGLVRVNTFLLPFGYLLAAVGVTRGCAALRGRVRTGAAVAAGLAYVLVLGLGARQAASVRGELGREAFAGGLRDFVATVREHGDPRDIVVLVHPMTEKGWRYYMAQRSGAGLRIGADRTLVVEANAVPAAEVDAFVTAHPGAPHVWVAALVGSGPAAVTTVLDVLAAHHYAPAGHWTDPLTGGMRELVPVASTA